jgi:hypothetical protein
MRRLFAGAAALAVVLALIAPATVAAAEPDYPAGVACSFALNIHVGDGGPQNVHELAYGAVLSAGRGNALTFENAATGKTLETPATGAVSRWVFSADGARLTMTGANVLIMYPTDMPAGPSTTLYIGRVVADFDLAWNTTLVSASGLSIDICRALS